MNLIKNSCPKTIWINRAKIEIMGDTDKVIDCYMNSINSILYY